MITLKKGDCLDLMKDIPDKSVDMILCDLPYGTTKCKWDTIIPFEPLWQQYKRVIKSGGAIVLFATEPFTSQLVSSNLNDYREHLTWIKHRPSNFMVAKYMHMKYTEDIIVFGNGRTKFNRQMMPRTSPRIAEMQNGNSMRHSTSSEVSLLTQLEPISWNHYDAKLKNPSDYLVFPSVVNNSREKTKHPTQKPVKLLEYLVKTYSDENDTVLDNCMGSGSTGVACKNLNRNFIGYELDDEYFEIAKKRIESHEEKLIFV